MSAEMQNYVFGTESSRYLREVVQAVREITSTSSSLATILDMVQYCCFCNWGFSLTILKLIMLQYMNTPSNELKPIFSLLAEVLILEDPLQMKRIQLVIEGHIDEHGLQHEGMLTVIRLNHVSDSRRSYQCIKFLVNLANKCPLAKDYLMQTPSKWQWAVNWLRKKMADYWSPSTTLSNEDSNRKSFQRTVSAQDTLAEATALLSELEGSGSEMDICGLSTGETEADSESQTQQDSQMTEDYEEETYQRNSQMS